MKPTHMAEQPSLWSRLFRQEDPMKRAVEIADAFYVYQKAIEAYRAAQPSNVIRFPIERTRAGRTL